MQVITQRRSFCKMLAAGRRARRVLRQSGGDRPRGGIFICFPKRLRCIGKVDMIYHKVQWQLATGGGKVQMLARLVYGPEFSVSPR
jgi:hypothetical protein